MHVTTVRESGREHALHKHTVCTDTTQLLRAGSQMEADLFMARWRLLFLHSAVAVCPLLRGPKSGLITWSRRQSLLNACVFMLRDVLSDLMPDKHKAGVR